MRLIDVDKVINSMQKCLDENPDEKDSVAYFAFETLITALKQEPTVDAVPVVHGRWVAVPSSDMMTGKAYKCSECGKMRYGSFMPNYCQCCGAKMDLEVKDA